MKTEPCTDCGSTTYVASTVDVDGVRSCAACLMGLTPLLRAGVPIAANVGEMGREVGTLSPLGRRAA